MTMSNDILIKPFSYYRTIPETFWLLWYFSDLVSSYFHLHSSMTAVLKGPCYGNNKAKTAVKSLSNISLLSYTKLIYMTLLESGYRGHVKSRHLIPLCMVSIWDMILCAHFSSTNETNCITFDSPWYVNKNFFLIIFQYLKMTTLWHSMHQKSTTNLHSLVQHMSKEAQQWKGLTEWAYQ